MTTATKIVCVLAFLAVLFAVVVYVLSTTTIHHS